MMYILLTITPIFSPQEINNVIKLATQLVMLTFGTSVGTYTRSMLFSKENTLKENIGLSFISSFIAFYIIIIKFEGSLDMSFSFIICVILGFFIPAFKSWFKGKTIFKILFRAFRKTADLTESVLDEVEKKLDEENDNEKKNG